MRRSGSATATDTPLVAWLDQLPAGATALAGGKGASLADLARAGFPVPPGFVVCAAAFHAFLGGCHGFDAISRLTNGLDVHDEAALAKVSRTLRDLVLSNPLPAAVDEAIRRACREAGEDTLVAVRSSAVSEDGEKASFAGQQETFLNVRGEESVVRRVRECWASLFSPRALFYRAQKGVLEDSRMAVVVQEMIPAEKSGVMFTADPVSKRRDHIVIEAIAGLGEAIVAGTVTPDHYVIDRKDGSVVREFIPPREEGSGVRVLSDREINWLREMGLRLEAFFGAPQDVEWCIRGDEFLLVQSRPITTLTSDESV